MTLCVITVLIPGLPVIITTTHTPVITMAHTRITALPCGPSLFYSMFTTTYTSVGGGVL